MANTIEVHCANDSLKRVLIAYQMDYQESSLTICCTVDKETPTWFNLKKFDLKFLRSQEKYVPLFIEANYKELSSSLFIEQVCKEIMKLECL